MNEGISPHSIKRVGLCDKLATLGTRSVLGTNLVRR